MFGGGELRSRLGLSVLEDFMQLVLASVLNVLYQIKFLLTARLLSLPNLSFIIRQVIHLPWGLPCMSNFDLA